MAKINRSKAQQTKGINNVLSGGMPLLEFTRKGVIKGLKKSIHIKRPNQYKK